MEPTLHIAFLHNFNLQFAEQPVDGTDLLVTQGIMTLLALYDAHPAIRADFFFTGYTDKYLADHHPAVIDHVKAMQARGQVAIGTYTYSHPVLTLLPYEDVRRQLMRGLEADQATWGFRPDGLLLPEVSWDVTLPEIMPELELEWVIVYDSLVPAFAGATSFPGTVWLEGIEGRSITGILAHDALRDPIWEIAQGEHAVDTYLARLERLQCSLASDQLLALKTDAEFLYFSGLARLGLQEGDQLPGEPPGLADMSRLYGALEALPYVRFTTVPEYLAENPPQETVYAESKGGNDALDRWLRGEGRERLNILEADAREHIHVADGILRLAEAQGHDTTGARDLYERAWDQLLLAENSDGRGFVPHPSRKIFVAQAAVRAARLARQAVDAIGKKSIS
jgi:hypothetical protein